MAAAQKGVGVVWGVSGITYTGFASTEPTQYTNSFNGERTANKKEILDGNGEWVGSIFYDARKKVSLSVTPYGTTTTIAAEHLEEMTPAIGSPIVIADSSTAGVFEGTYTLISVKQNRSATGEATIDMELELSTANAVTAAITA